MERVNGMTEQWYSLKGIAKEMNTTWQSIRSWKEQFHQYVPMDVEGKQVRFKKEALAVFQFIKEAKDNGLDHHDIREGLGNKFGQADHALAEVDAETSQEQDHAKVDLEMLENMMKTIGLLQQEVNELKVKLSEVEIAKRDQELVENLNKIRDRKRKGILSRVMNFTF